MGEFFADFMPQILNGSQSEKVEQQIADMVRLGAVQQRIRAEFAVFNCFVSWTGMAGALQRGKVREAQFDQMLGAFYRRLDELSNQETLDPSVSVSYTSFAEYLHARLNDYINVSTTADNQSVNSLVVEKFCDYACDDERNDSLKMMIMRAYVLGSATVYDILAGTRLQ